MVIQTLWVKFPEAYFVRFSIVLNERLTACYDDLYEAKKLKRDLVGFVNVVLTSLCYFFRVNWVGDGHPKFIGVFLKNSPYFLDNFTL